MWQPAFSKPFPKKNALGAASPSENKPPNGLRRMAARQVLLLWVERALRRASDIGDSAPSVITAGGHSLIFMRRDLTEGGAAQRCPKANRVRAETAPAEVLFKTGTVKSSGPTAAELEALCPSARFAWARPFPPEDVPADRAAHPQRLFRHFCAGAFSALCLARRRSNSSRASTGVVEKSGTASGASSVKAETS